ncbi:MAG: trypsin-like peptidase domain-containing protein, partial [Bacteroidales bacterium]
FKASLVGYDPNTDLPLLKIDAKNLPSIPFGNSDVLKVGEWVLAVGNPFNLTSTVTAGIVSAKARNINILNSAMKIESFIQTDAAINPGNSGGALVNTKGELIGINTAIASQTGSYAGYGFAIPISIASKVIADLKQFGVVQRAFLGIEIREVDEALAKEKNLKSLEGVYVAKVNEHSSASLAGIKEGDIILKVNGNTITSVSQLQEQVGRYSPGDVVTLQIVRNKNSMDVKVLLKNRQGTTKLVKSNQDLSVLSAEFTEISPRVKQSLGLEYGMQITEIQKGKLASAGVKEGFIILKINTMDIRSLEDIQAALELAINNGDRDKVLFIAGLYPNGKVAYYAVDLN